MRHARYIFLLILLFAVLTGCKREDEEIIPGLSWTMSDANPVLEPSNAPSTDLVSGWYNKNVWFPWVIKDGPTLKMWFTGTNTEGEERIGYATGSNGEDWTIQALVFEPSITPGSWDSGGVWNHCVIKDGGEYKMFYTGYENATNADDRIGLAYSTDGLVWVREAANPVIGPGPAGSWYEKAVYSGAVIATGTTYQMWFSGVAANGIVRTGYTSSTDCVTWDAPVIVLEVGPKPYDSYMAFLPCVLLHEEVYHMWYTGLGPGGYAFCYATSADGLNWGKHGVAGRDGTPGVWEDSYFIGACVILDIATFRMWYSAVCSLDGRARIGYATSPAPQVP